MYNFCSKDDNIDDLVLRNDADLINRFEDVIINLISVLRDSGHHVPLYGSERFRMHTQDNPKIQKQI